MDASKHISASVYQVRWSGYLSAPSLWEWCVCSGSFFMIVVSDGLCWTHAAGSDDLSWIWAMLWSSLLQKYNTTVLKWQVWKKNILHILSESARKRIDVWKICIHQTDASSCKTTWWICLLTAAVTWLFSWIFGRFLQNSLRKKEYAKYL